MSGVGSNPTLKRAATPSEDLSHAPATRKAKTHGDLIKELENEYIRLRGGQKDYNLLSRIERLYQEVNRAQQEGGAFGGVISWVASWGAPTDADKINNLFDRALNRHGLTNGPTRGFEGNLCNLENLERLARQGDLEGLQFLLSNGRTIDQGGLHRVAACAARNGNIECLKFLLSDGRALDREGLNLVMDASVRYGQLDCLKILLTDGRAIDQRHLATLATNAIINGHLESLEFLLGEGRTLDYQGLVNVAASAAQIGQVQALEFLLSQGRSLNQRGLAHVVGSAAANGQFECLMFLLSDRSRISNYILEIAANSAAKEGHLDCLEFILTVGIIGLKDDINPSHIKTKETEFDFSSIPEDVKIEALLTFLAQSDFPVDEKNAIEAGINKIIDYINHKTPFLGTPPAGSAELNVFYDNIKNMLRFCVNQLINEEREFLEARGGVAPAPGSEDYNKYLAILDGKKRILKQMSEASSHCGARWMGEVLVLYSMKQPLACDSFDKAILNQLSLLRRDLLNQLIHNPNNPDTHLYGAVMQAVGPIVGVPGADLAIESLQRFSVTAVYRFITEFTSLYTSEKILDEIRNLFKTNQGFREQAYDWIQSQKIDSKQKDYKDEAVALIRDLKAIALEEIEVNGSNKEHIDLLFGFLEELKKEPGFLKENYLSKSSVRELFDQFLESSQFKPYFNANLKKEASFFEGRVGKFINPQVLRNAFQTLIEEEDQISKGALLVAIKDVLEGKENSFSSSASQEDIKLKTIRSVLRDQLLSDVAVGSLEEISSPDFIEKITSGFERKRRREFLSEIVQEDGSLSDATWREILVENNILSLGGL